MSRRRSDGGRLLCLGGGKQFPKLQYLSRSFDLDPNRFAFAHPRRPACSFQPREHFLRLLLNPRLSPENIKPTKMFALTRPAILASTKRAFATTPTALPRGEQSIIPLSNVEAHWATLNTGEQANRPPTTRRPAKTRFEVAQPRREEGWLVDYISVNRTIVARSRQAIPKIWLLEHSVVTLK